MEGWIRGVDEEDRSGGGRCRGQRRRSPLTMLVIVKEQCPHEAPLQVVLRIIVGYC